MMPRTEHPAPIFPTSPADGLRAGFAIGLAIALAAAFCAGRAQAQDSVTFLASYRPAQLSLPAPASPRMPAIPRGTASPRAQLPGLSAHAAGKRGRLPGDLLPAYPSDPGQASLPFRSCPEGPEVTVVVGSVFIKDVPKGCLHPVALLVHRPTVGIAVWF